MKKYLYRFLGIYHRMFSQVPGHTQNRHQNSNRTQCALLPCPHLAWAATSLTWPTNFETLLLEFFASVPKKPTNVKKNTVETNNNSTSLFYNPIKFCFNFVCFFMRFWKVKNRLILVFWYGTIPVLRQQFVWLFLTHPPYVSINCRFSDPTHPVPLLT